MSSLGGPALPCGSSFTVCSANGAAVDPLSRAQARDGGLLPRSELRGAAGVPWKPPHRRELSTKVPGTECARDTAEDPAVDGAGMASLRAGAAAGGRLAVQRQSAIRAASTSCTACNTAPDGAAKPPQPHNGGSPMRHAIIKAGGGVLLVQGAASAPRGGGGGGRRGPSAAGATPCAARERAGRPRPGARASGPASTAAPAPRWSAAPLAAAAAPPAAAAPKRPACRCPC